MDARVCARGRTSLWACCVTRLVYGAPRVDRINTPEARMSTYRITFTDGRPDETVEADTVELRGEHLELVREILVAGRPRRQILRRLVAREVTVAPAPPR